MQASDLSAGPSWTEATALLREQLADGKAPDFDTRLKLAEVLLSSGRRDEARQAFLKLAAEAEREGHTARAVAILRKLDEMWPESDEADGRLAAIARERPGGSQSAPAEAALPAPPLRPSEAQAADSPIEVEPAVAFGDSLSEIEALLDEPALEDDLSTQETLRDEPAADAGDETADPAATEDFLGLASRALQVTPAADEKPAETSSAGGIFASPLFAGLSEQETFSILRRLRVADFEAGDILVTEGEEGNSVFVISSGRVDVFVRSPTGHDVLVALLGEGDFFGELSAISGKRRMATVSAATPCELLELSKSDVDELAKAHPRIRSALDAAFVQRASHLAAAVARTIDLTAQGHVREYADVALAARFGRSRWNPRVRLRLCYALIRAGHEEAAVPILAELANALVRAGRPEKAQVLLQKIEKLVSPEIQEICLTPLKRSAPSLAAGSTNEPDAERLRRLSSEMSGFRRWLQEMTREKADATPTPQEPGDNGLLESYGPGLSICPLFEGLGPEDLVDLVGGLRVLRVDAGDMIVTEGESGLSLFAVLGGSVKVWSRDAEGRNQLICRLGEGEFVGEVATLSGRPRCASVTAAEACVLLEMTREDVASLRAKHPQIGEVLDGYLARRSGETARPEGPSAAPFRPPVDG